MAAGGDRDAEIIRLKEKVSELETILETSTRTKLFELARLNGQVQGYELAMRVIIQAIMGERGAHG